MTTLFSKWVWENLRQMKTSILWCDRSGSWATISKDCVSKCGVIGLAQRKWALSLWRKTRRITAEYVEAFRSLCGKYTENSRVRQRASHQRRTRHTQNRGHIISVQESIWSWVSSNRTCQCCKWTVGVIWCKKEYQYRFSRKRKDGRLICRETTVTVHQSEELLRPRIKVKY